MLIFVLGGTRSGKTKYALNYGENLFHFSNFFYIATAEPVDEEMQARIKEHQASRSDKWQLIEEPVKLWEVLDKIPDSSVAIIDCLTVWLGNLMNYQMDVKKCCEMFLNSLKKFVSSTEHCMICVANEVGLGVVPETKMGRDFRDIAGKLNQDVAELSDEVYFLVAGCPLKLKAI